MASHSGFCTLSRSSSLLGKVRDSGTVHLAYWCMHMGHQYMLTLLRAEKRAACSPMYFAWHCSWDGGIRPYCIICPPPTLLLGHHADP